MTFDRRAFHRIVLGLFVASGAACTRREGTESPHRELYLLDDDDRQARLLAGAREEGVVVIYTSLNTQDSGPLTQAFEERFGVETQLWRSSSDGVVQRAVAEASAGRLTYDVVETNGPEMEACFREGLLERFHSPHFRDLAPAAFPTHRYYVADRFNFFTIAYNTDLVSPDEAPNSYEDLLHPRFEGRLGLEAGDVDWFGAMVKHMGEEPGLTRRAPHPHAALLFADFLLSPEGQTILKDRSRVPSSRAVTSPLNDFLFQTIDPVISLDEDEKWSTMWSELFLKGQAVPRDVA
jgi:ABC-type Fe3+ transport system substrate-binding protein